jgi:hypothetical protein
MKSLILLFFMTFAVNCMAIDCSKHPIYCRIKILNPSMDNATANQLGNLIYKYSKKYHQDPYRAVAIAMQESGLRNVNKSSNGLILENICDSDGVCEQKYKEGTVYTDIGIFQFHIETIKNYNINVNLLINNMEYAVDQYFKLMTQKVKMCKNLGDDAWSCYHSNTEQYRQQYKDLVNRYYKVK